jgi:hypothetical protein
MLAFVLRDFVSGLVPVAGSCYENGRALLAEHHFTKFHTTLSSLSFDVARAQEVHRQFTLL